MTKSNKHPGRKNETRIGHISLCYSLYYGFSYYSERVCVREPTNSPATFRRTLSCIRRTVHWCVWMSVYVQWRLHWVALLLYVSNAIYTYILTWVTSLYRLFVRLLARSLISFCLTQCYQLWCCTELNSLLESNTIYTRT